MRRVSLFVLAGMLAGAVLLRTSGSQTQPAAPPAGPQFTADGKLVRPEGYRRWVYVSSGFGMSYSANAANNGDPAFISTEAIRTSSLGWLWK